MIRRYFRVPLVNVPQRFSINLGGRDFTIVSRWNDVVGAWFLDLYDANTQAPLVLSMPLVTGADLLAQYRHLGINGHLVAFTDGDAWAMPTFANLGAEGRLTYAVEQ